MRQEAGSREQGTGIALVRMPVRRVEAERVVREATTGRVVSVVASTAGTQETEAKPRMRLLPRVWAVAESGEVQEVESPAGVQSSLLMRAPESASPDQANQEAETEQRTGVAFYRKYTEGMLRRYVRLSMEAGRVPSLLGRELFRGKVTSYKVTNFEDVVIFCFDMERVLSRLRPMDQRLIKRVAMQEYTQGEVASMMRISLRSCIRMYGLAVDRLTEMLLEAGMLEPLKRCQ